MDIMEDEGNAGFYAVLVTSSGVQMVWQPLDLANEGA